MSVWWAWRVSRGWPAVHARARTPRGGIRTPWVPVVADCAGECRSRVACSLDRRLASWAAGTGPWLGRRGEGDEEVAWCLCVVRWSGSGED